jgi:hypothetical protein
MKRRRTMMMTDQNVAEIFLVPFNAMQWVERERGRRETVRMRRVLLKSLHYNKNKWSDSQRRDDVVETQMNELNT